MRTVIHFVQDICLMLSRIVLGLVLVMHGWHRWDTGMDKQVAFLSEHGVPQPEALAWGATALELIGGVMLVFGVLTPLVAAFVVAENALVVAWIKLRNGWSVTHDGWEYNVVLAALALLFVGHGSGRAGVDALFRSHKADDPERKVIRENP